MQWLQQCPRCTWSSTQMASSRQSAPGVSCSLAITACSLTPLVRPAGLTPANSGVFQQLLPSMRDSLRQAGAPEQVVVRAAGNAVPLELASLFVNAVDRWAPDATLVLKARVSVPCIHASAPPRADTSQCFLVPVGWCAVSGPMIACFCGKPITPGLAVSELISRHEALRSLEPVASSLLGEHCLLYAAQREVCSGKQHVAALPVRCMHLLSAPGWAWTPLSTWRSSGHRHMAALAACAAVVVCSVMRPAHAR